MYGIRSCRVCVGGLCVSPLQKKHVTFGVMAPIRLAPRCFFYDSAGYCLVQLGEFQSGAMHFKNLIEKELWIIFFPAKHRLRTAV